MNAIVAANADWGIGCGGTQSIVIPEDRQHFKNITNGGVVIAGRKTFEDFGRPLPNRRNIVLTRSESFSAQGIIAVRSLPQLMAAIDGDDPAGVFVIGGESIYRALLPMCEYAYVTKIDAAPPSDTFFPNLDEMPEWEIAEQGPLHAFEMKEKTVYYSFIIYKNMRN